MRLGPPVPILRSFDEAKARAFWIDWLGFAVEWEHRFEPGLPLYMQIRRDGCVLHVSEHPGDATPGGAVRIEADLDALLSEIAGRGYPARPAVEDQPWGAQEVELRDPFGNRVVFWRAS